MTLAKIEGLTVSVRKTVKAPIEKVFKGFTDASEMIKWFGCGKVTNVQISQDFRVDGNYRVEGENCEENAPVVVYGTYKEIVPNKKVVYTWTNESKEYPAQDTLVSVEFIVRGDSTEIVLEHSKLESEKAKEGHSFGWTASLEKFASLYGDQ